MAAGHPRISFELDLFSELQRHYDVDAYYAARKTIAGGVKIWAVGQAMALERALTLYQSPRGSQGQFPEFTFFDCYSCHRTISNDPNWSPRANANPGRPIPVGQPPFNDSNIIMLIAAVRATAPGLDDRFEVADAGLPSGAGREPRKCRPRRRRSRTNRARAGRQFRVASLLARRGFRDPRPADGRHACGALHRLCRRRAGGDGRRHAAEARSLPIGW